jgi:hypothetical protein
MPDQGMRSAQRNRLKQLRNCFTYRFQRFDRLLRFYRRLQLAHDWNFAEFSAPRGIMMLTEARTERSASSRFPPRRLGRAGEMEKLNTKEEYQAAIDRANEIFFYPEGTPEFSEMNRLAELIDDYEERRRFSLRRKAAALTLSAVDDESE